MPVIINSLEVSQEPNRAANPAQAPAAEATAAARPDPQEVRRLLERAAERLARLWAH
jgi:hypothetical protein